MEAGRSSPTFDVSFQGKEESHAAAEQADPSLRMRLRTETRPSHERLDRLAGRLSFSEYEDMHAFIRATCLAYRSLASVAGDAKPRSTHDVVLVGEKM